MWHAILSYPNPIVTGPRHNLLLQMRLWVPSHSGITISSTLEEIHEHNQPTWRRKGSNLITRFTSQENSNLSWGNSEYLQVWNTTFCVKWKNFLHREIWDFHSGVCEDLCLQGSYSVSTGKKSYWHLEPPLHLPCQGQAVADSFNYLPVNMIQYPRHINLLFLHCLTGSAT